MAVRGQHSPQAAMIAALDTRRAKDSDVNPVELRAHWASTARSLGFYSESLGAALHRTEARPLGTAEQTLTEDRLFSKEGLTAHDSSFDRNDILRAWCDQPPAGAPILGVDTSRHVSATVAFPPGSSIVMYTDGLVERRDRRFSVGVTAAASILRDQAPDLGLEERISGLVRELLGTAAPSDDVAIIDVTRVD